MKIQTSPLKYQQIWSDLTSSIQSGTYQVGDKLPSEKELSDSFGASRSTIIRALRAIEEQGLIERRQGSGSFITLKATQPTPTRTTFGMLKAVQSGRYADSVVDQIQNRLSALLQQRGSALIVHTIEKNDHPVAVARNLTEQRIGGTFMVAMPTGFSSTPNQEIVDTLTDAGRPIVLLDGDIVTFPHRSNLDVVGIENRHCGYLLTDHLLKLGLRRILFIGSNPAAPTVTERQLGYLDAMSAHQIEVPPEWICGVASDDINESFVARLIDDQRPEGIVCKSDEFAALFMRHLPALGVRVPQDLKLVGFDDRPIASLLPVTLTTIRQPIEEMTDAALHLMDRRLAQPERSACRIQLAGKLIVRHSSAK